MPKTIKASDLRKATAKGWFNCMEIPYLKCKTCGFYVKGECTSRIMTDRYKIDFDKVGERVWFYELKQFKI
jgi:hypothetical protein